MSAGKPARYIGILTQKLKMYERDAERRTQELDSAQETARRLLAGKRAAERTVAEREQEIETLKSERDQARAQIAEWTRLDAAIHTGMIALLGKDRAETMHADPLGCMAEMLHVRKLEVQQSHARIAELEARGPELDAKEAEIRAMVERVQERMRRDEREKANAILNRKALAGVVPGLRRR